MSDPAETSARPSAPQPGSWVSLAAQGVFIIAAVSLTVLGLFERLALYQLVLIVALICFFPLSYLSYRQFRFEIHKERVKDDFRLLGLVQGADRADALDVLYRQIYGWQQFFIFVVLAASATLLGFGLFFYREDLSFLSATVAETMFHAFLGAYTFSIYYVYRRYITLDLQPGVYLYITVRLITVQAVAYVAAQQWRDAAEGAQALVPIIAFVIGYLPDTGIRWLISIAGRVLGRVGLQRNERQLSDIEGISLWHETRLRESGIDNVQNLAAADVRELLLGSRFSAQQLMHWIDQALLIASLAQDKYEKLRDNGVRTISAFRLLMDRVTVDGMPKLAGTTDEELKTLYSAIYYSAETGPNLHYVAQYWQAVKQYRTEIVAGGLAEMLRERAAQVAQTRFSDPLVVERLSQVLASLEIDPEDLELLFPDAPESLVGLGSVYIAREFFDRAESVLTRAIEVDSQSAAAFSYRGLAHAMRGAYDLAFADFERAKRLEQTYALVFNHEGMAHIQKGAYPEAIAALNHAIELDPRFALAYYHRGFARRVQGQRDEAITDLSQALRYNPDFGLAYSERGLIYLSLSDFGTAIRDFDDAIRLDRGNAQAYRYRGVAYAALGDYRRAIYDLSTAIDIDPELAEAFANRGEAKLALDDTMGAISDFDRALSLDMRLAQTYRNRALAHEQQSAWAEAAADFQSYLRLFPNAPDAQAVRDRLGQIQQRLSGETPPADTDGG